MKAVMVCVLLASQVVSAASPALAASIVDNQMSSQRSTGAFAGARLRMPIGGREKGPKAGFALTSVQRNGSAGTMGFSTGVELGVAGGTAGLSIGNQRLGAKPAAFSPRPGEAPTGRKAGASTLGWVLMGVGTLAVLAAGALVICQETNCTNSD